MGPDGIIASVSGCDQCGSRVGCDHRKEFMFGSIEAALERLYPERRWGEMDAAASLGAGIAPEEGAALAEELAAELDAATVFRPGEEGEYCDYIYVLCIGREPCLVQIRDAEVPVPAELGPGEPIFEQYLRVCLSSLVRFAGVQQTAVEGELAGAALEIVERPRSGVYDAPLLPRFQRLVARLTARDILHLDFGEISAPPPGFDPAGYAALYGGAPAVANYLFYPHPPNTVVTTAIRV
jgi:hypothetical protein